MRQVLGEGSDPAYTPGGAARPWRHPGVGVCRSARRRDTHAHPRGGVHGRAELGEGLRAARGSFPCRGRRPARPWRRIRAGSRFRLEDCADDVAALAGILGTGRFTAVGYSMVWAAWSPSWCTGGTPRCCRVWCCAPPRAARGVPGAGSWPPSRCRRRPPPCGGTRFCSWSAPRASGWRCSAPSTTRPRPGDRAQLRRTTLASAVSASRAVCEFSSDRWIGQVDVPAAVVVTTGTA